MYDKIGKVRLQQRFIVMETGCLFCLGSSNSKFPASLYKLNLASSGTIDTPQRPVCSLPFGRSFFRGHYYSPRSGFFLMFIILVWMILQQTVHTTFSKISKLHNWKLRSLWRSDHANREWKSCFTLICFWWDKILPTKSFLFPLYSLFILEQQWQLLNISNTSLSL